MKDLTKNETITNALKVKQQLIEIVFTAAVLTLGINLLSYYITQPYSPGNNLVFLYFGIFFIAIAAIVLILKLRETSREEEIDCVISINIEDHQLIKIMGYRFSTDLNDVITAGLKENKAWKTTWENNPLISLKNITSKSENVIPLGVTTIENKKTFSSVIENEEISAAVRENKSNKLLVEAVEFMIIDQLSKHLSEHFNKISPKKKPLVKKYQREDFSAFLLKNRFLNLLTTPFEDRAEFIGISKSDIKEKGELTFIKGTDGTIYRRLILTLPTNTKLEKTDDSSSFCVTTSRFKLSMCINSEGYGHIMPSGFEYAYIKNDQNIKSLKLKIRIKADVRLLSLLTFSNWEYYTWMDSYINTLKEKYSFSSFLKEINWSEASTNLHITQIMRSKEKNK